MIHIYKSSQNVFRSAVSLINVIGNQWLLRHVSYSQLNTGNETPSGKYFSTDLILKNVMCLLKISALSTMGVPLLQCSRNSYLMKKCVQSWQSIPLNSVTRVV